MIHEQAFVPDNIFLVGVGGVGSRVLRELSFLIRGNLDSGTGRSNITIVDPDILEAHNLNRQDYYPWEAIRAPKTAILQNRYKGVINLKQIPEGFNRATAELILTPTVLQSKILFIVCGDNPEVVKQSLEYLSEKAGNDWLWMFTGGYQEERVLLEGYPARAVGIGQAFSYGKVGGNPTYGVPVQQIIPDIMSAAGSGLSSEGQGCGVTPNSGIQTPLMNYYCCLCIMELLVNFFEYGIYLLGVEFVNSLSVTFGVKIPLQKIREGILDDCLDAVAIDPNDLPVQHENALAPVEEEEDATESEA